MPVAYHFNSEDRIVEITCSGELTLREIMQYYEDLRVDRTVLNGAVELVDLSRIEHFNVDFRGASSLPSGYQPAHQAKEVRATILFGMNPLNQGLAGLIRAHFAQTLPYHPFHLAGSAAKARSLAASVHAAFEEGAS